MTPQEAESLLDLMRDEGPDEFFGTVAALCGSLEEWERDYDAPDLAALWKKWKTHLEEARALEPGVKEIERRTLYQFGSVYRIANYEIGKHRFAVEVNPLNADGTLDENEWGSIGGSPGLETAEFTTLERAREFLDKVALLDPEDEDAFWILLEACVRADNA